MTKISEAEFAKICNGIYEDREIIIKHNPIGSDEEVLLWMLLSVLISYLSLDENEIPCFPNSTSLETYRQAILFIMNDRKSEDFEVEKYLEKLC
ncbi:MAG: hypothetical protein K1X72_08240 [Pyrinomonadaceae bacterium]|nr:hypothetical protein [Pyrinomonadaceae bacterium]